MMNPLDRYPRVREVAYLVWWVASGVVGTAMAVYVAQPAEALPDWVLIAALVVSYSGVYLGFTAQRNVTGTDEKGLPMAPVDKEGTTV